jgi:tetratricopeptide (TPR) repeat protein
MTLRKMASSKNVIPAKAGIQKLLTLLDPRLRGSDKLIIIRGSQIAFVIFVVLLGITGTRCAVTKEDTHAHGETASVKTYPKGYVHPLTEINLDKVINENRGLKVLEENATTAHDYYRGGVQQKAEGERLLKEGKWEEALTRFETSNRFFQVVLRYLSEDEAYRNIYGDHVVIFLPNLLSADNYLKLANIYQKMGRDDKALEEKGHGEYYLSESLKNVKTEWAFQVQKGLEGLSPKK